MALPVEYIAQGFSHDAGKLMNEFIQLNSVNFPEFATLWKQNHFSLVFMGRPEITEATEFVNEIFRITSQYLFTESFYQQVGAVFMLYALFRNQILNPPVKIRIEIRQWKVIRTLLFEAVEKKYRTLHYVIDYLKKHAFLYVANQTLRGPLMGSQPVSSQHDVEFYKLRKNCKSDFLAYSESNELANLLDLKKQYIAEKNKTACCANIKLITNTTAYEESINDMAEMVKRIRQYEVLQKIPNSRSGISKIVDESFNRKTKDRFGVEIKVERPSGSSSKESYIRRPGRPTNEERKTCRPPKEKRRVGRPSKKAKSPKEISSEEDDDLDISHLLEQHRNFYLPPVNRETKKNRSKRDSYYQVSPKKSEIESDSDS